MSKNALFALSLGGLAVLGSGCVEHRTVYVPAQQPGVAYNTPPPSYAPAPQPVPEVAQAPPAAQVEAIPPSPGPVYVWTPGYWYWGTGGWMWIGGRYVARPYPHAVWVRPRYVRHGHGYVWVRGYWR